MCTPAPHAHWKGENVLAASRPAAPTSRSAWPLPPLPRSWQPALEPATRAPWFHELRAFLASEARRYTILPPAAEVFRALELTPPRRLRVLLLGQDPYHGVGQAHGLCFSVRPGVKPPASLRNMFRELHDDLGIVPPPHGCLDAWARQGVLLLNAVLTVRAGEPNSHRGRGWERFTDAIIRCADRRRSPLVFALWGNHAQRKAGLIDSTRHAVITAAHPSPLAAARGFLGSRVYSRINAALLERGAEPIDWRL